MREVASAWHATEKSIIATPVSLSEDWGGSYVLYVLNGFEKEESGTTRQMQMTVANGLDEMVGAHLYSACKQSSKLNLSPFYRHF